LRLGGAVPRYYFHIRSDDVRVEDLAGLEVPPTESLDEKAIEAARDLLADGDLQGLDRRGWVYEVTDETGTTVLTLAFKDAIEPVPAQAQEASNPSESSQPKG
jgi:hypothetical protein